MSCHQWTLSPGWISCLQCGHTRGSGLSTNHGFWYSKLPAITHSPGCPPPLILANLARPERGCSASSDHGPERFTAALHRLARDLGTATSLVDYHHRREALRNWYLTPGAWQEIIDRLPPVPGPVQPVLDDRKRQMASPG